MTSQAAGIAAEGNVGIQAGRDVNLLAEATTTGSSSHSGKKTVIDESVRQQGTESPAAATPRYSPDAT
jgi:filamentous hemagglutinin